MLDKLLLSVKLNIRFFALLVIKKSFFLVPCKKYVVDTIGVVWGIISCLRHISSWKSIGKSRRPILNAEHPYRFAIKYFIQFKKNRVWQTFLRECSYLACHMKVEDSGLFERIRESNKGAIILGAHYGPQVNLFFLKKLGVNAKGLFGPWMLGANEQKGYLLPVFRKNLELVWIEEEPFVMNKSEKSVLKHLLNGGSIFMMLDLWNKTKGVKAWLFDREGSFSYFPFKVALNYGIPVYFFIIARAGAGNGYVVRLVQINDFSTEEEGIKRYMDLLQQEIKRCPYMWEFALYFAK